MRTLFHLRHAVEEAVGRHAGVLEDYGNLAEGLLALHQATGEGRWLELAGDLLDVVGEQFTDSDGWHDTAADAEALVHRGQVTSVFVVEQDVARVRLVNVSGTEVLAGLSEGDVVIVVPPPGLTDGSRVTAGVR